MAVVWGEWQDGYRDEASPRSLGPRPYSLLLEKKIGENVGGQWESGGRLSTARSEVQRYHAPFLYRR